MLKPQGNEEDRVILTKLSFGSDVTHLASETRPGPLFTQCSLLFDAHAQYMHKCTQTQSAPHGPVFPAGLSAFSLLSSHLHTNSVC